MMQHELEAIREALHIAKERLEIIRVNELIVCDRLGCKGEKHHPDCVKSYAGVA